jgi:adiponectin receptor
LQYLAGKYPRVTSSDFIAFSFFILTATICYVFSALYHTLMNHSYTVDRFCHRLDMLGIGIFIVGDIILGVYIIFWCETTLRNIYWSMVSSLSVLLLLIGSNTIGQ